jgi:osmotically-inducible protein OsmY
MKKLLLMTTAALLTTVVGTPAEDPKRDADNTGKNERDRSGETKTPVDQSNDPADLKITRDVRQAVIGDDELSATAKNVKIITSAGKVTLRGPVNTDEEKKKVARLAEGIAGSGKVDNQLEIKAAK